MRRQEKPESIGSKGPKQNPANKESYTLEPNYTEYSELSKSPRARKGKDLPPNKREAQSGLDAIP